MKNIIHKININTALGIFFSIVFLSLLSLIILAPDNFITAWLFGNQIFLIIIFAILFLFIFSGLKPSHKELREIDFKVIRSILDNK